MTGRIARLVGLTLLAGACQGTFSPSDLVGPWGAAHVEVTFDGNGAGAIQFDCAHARLVAPIAVSPDGTVSATGEYVQEHGGPAREGEPEDLHPARYAGRIRGDRLTFTVTLMDSGTDLGPYTAERGHAATLFRCL